MEGKDTCASVRKHHPGLAGPVILICLGLIFLLNNLGVLSWSVWETLARLWPVLLIAIGLDVLFGRRTAWGTWVILGFVLLIAAAAVWYSGAWAGSPVYWEAETQVISQPLAGATQADVEINTAIGRMVIGPLTGSDRLVEGMIAQSRLFRVVPEFSITGDTAYYKLKNEANNGYRPFIGRSSRTWRWDLRLNPDVPMRLALNTGAGESEIDLREVRLTDLRVNAGVGKISLTLPARGRLQARIDTGVGKAEIIVPRGMAAWIRIQSGIGSADVHGDFTARGRHEYVSPGYDQAENRIDLEVHCGIGQITIDEG